jgi:RimJ/RimL family protein N-acetyltransferase
MTITIRQWAADDLSNLVLHANNTNVWNNLRNYFPSPYTEEDAKNWLEKMATDSPIVNLAIDIDGQAVGGIGLILNADVYVYSAEISYWIGEPFWNQGVATEAIRQMIEYCNYYFDIVRIYAEVFESNKASMRALEKNGFYLEGVRRKAVYKNAVLMDDYIWVKLRAW